MKQPKRSLAGRQPEWSEDDKARANLGGVKGSRKLPAAPMTKQQQEKVPKNNDPGHTA